MTVGIERELPSESGHDISVNQAFQRESSNLVNMTN